MVDTLQTYTVGILQEVNAITDHSTLRGYAGDGAIKYSGMTYQTFALGNTSAITGTDESTGHGRSQDSYDGIGLIGEFISL